MKTDESVISIGYELFYYTVDVYSSGESKSMYELSPSRQKRGALTSIGYPNGYPSDILQRLLGIALQIIELFFIIFV